MSKKGRIPVGLDLELQGTGSQRSKHFPEHGSVPVDQAQDNL